MKEFDVQNFWKDKLNLDKIIDSKKRYPTVDEIFTDQQLSDGFNESPYFYYPLSRWLFDCDKSPTYKKALCLLDTQLFTFDKYNIKGFKERIETLPKQSDQVSFYSFLGELALAWHFYRYRDFTVEFFDFTGSKDRKPDLKVIDNFYNKELFIEVYTQFKFYFRLKRLEELLGEIDHRLCIGRDLFLQSPFSSLDRTKINELINSILEKLRSQEIQERIRREYKIVLYEEGNLQIYLEIDENQENNKPGPNKSGEQLITYKVQLEEIFKEKGEHGQLKNYHPNILAINGLFNEDFQVGCYKFELPNEQLQANNKPEFIDTFYLFAVGIDSELIDFKSQGNLFWPTNESDKNVENIRRMTLPL